MRLPISRTACLAALVSLSFAFGLCGDTVGANAKTCSSKSSHAKKHVKKPARRKSGKHVQVVQYYGSSRTNGFTRTPSRSPYRTAMMYTGGSGDYVSQTDGISRWPEGHTIRVYVAPARNTFPGIVAHCFNEWSRATGGRINYQMVGDPSAADYVVSWTSRQHEASDGTEAGLTTTDTYIDPETEEEFIDHAQTRVLTRFDGRTLSDKEIAETCLHEIGHGLGIEGHSSNPSDIMYYAVSSRQTGHLTPRDANTIARLYSL